MGKRSEGFERRERGFYPTPWAAFEPLIPHLPFEAKVAEPCAGDGALCYHLAVAGWIPAWASDIAPRHSNVVELDAIGLKESSPDFNLIVTNPPWPAPGGNGEPTLSILNHLRSLAPTWLLLPSDFMHNVYAAEPMRFCHKIVSVGRVKWIPESDQAGKDNCAWYLFTRQPADRVAFVGRQAKRREA